MSIVIIPHIRNIDKIDYCYQHQIYIKYYITNNEEIRMFHFIAMWRQRNAVNNKTDHNNHMNNNSCNKSHMSVIFCNKYYQY